MASYRAAVFDRVAHQHRPPAAPAGGEAVKPAAPYAPVAAAVAGPIKGKLDSPTLEESLASIAQFHDRVRAERADRLYDGFEAEYAPSKRTKIVSPIEIIPSDESLHAGIPGLHTVHPARLAIPFDRYHASPLCFGADGDWHSVFAAAHASVSALNNVHVVTSLSQGSLRCALGEEVFFLVTVRQLEREDAASLGTKQLVEIIVQIDETERVEWPVTMDRLMSHPAFSATKVSRFSPA